jgi:hypothetical protein
MKNLIFWQVTCFQYCGSHEERGEWLKAIEATGGNFVRLRPKNPTLKNWLISSIKLSGPWTSEQKASDRIPLTQFGQL